MYHFDNYHVSGVNQKTKILKAKCKIKLRKMLKHLILSQMTAADY